MATPFRWRLLGKLARVLFRVAETLSGLPGMRYVRFLTLHETALRAFNKRQLTRSESLTRELLSLSLDYRWDWNYANAIHHGHIQLGRVALARGDLSTARTELLEAGRVSGSPQLNSFGPNMQLALELLREGDRAVVLEYFRLCRTFWELGRSELDTWEDEVVRGQVPKFGDNVRY
jgi:hypothetical protein